MKLTWARLLGDVSWKECLVSALLIILLVVPATCAVHPKPGDDGVETVR